MGASHRSTRTSRKTVATMFGASSASNGVGAYPSVSSGSLARLEVLATKSPPGRRTRAASARGAAGLSRWYSIQSALTAPAESLSTGRADASARTFGCGASARCVGGQVHNDRGPSPRQQRLEETSAATDVQYGRELIADDPVCDWFVHVAEDLGGAVVTAPALGIRVVVGRERGHQSPVRASTGRV